MKLKSNNILWLGALGLLLYALVFSIWTIWATETGNGDNAEHLHATWLVAYGNMPYRDFFQHHNPLLWYIFAPLVKHFDNLLELLDFAHTMGLIAGIATFFVVYKICTEFFASKLSALISILILCPPYYYVFCFNYNPDTFMALSYAIGIYFLFGYWRTKQQQRLCASFLCFLMAFLFTQKIIIPLFLLGIISLVIFYKLRVPLLDVVYALILPVLGSVVFVAWLYHNGALSQYWLSNYPFNVIMQKYYGFNKINVMDHEMLVFSIFSAIISVLLFFKSSNIFFKVVAILFAIELPLRCFYFSIAPYYMLPLMIYTVCLNSVLLERIMQKQSCALMVFLIVAAYYAFISTPKYLAHRGQDRSFARFLNRNVTPCDYVLSSYLGNQSIMSKDPYYYWAMLGHIDMAGEETGLAPRAPITDLVRAYLPKIVYGGAYKSSYAENHGYTEIIQQVAPEILEKYYISTPFSGFYLLKPEYRHKNCKYNSIKKGWYYVD